MLANACYPATFGRNGEDVLDESYRRAGVLLPGNFSTGLSPSELGLGHVVSEFLEGENGLRPVLLKLDKLNVYAGKGEFFKAHKDTPRASSMFGSLVVVLPTPHDGGALVLRHKGEEYKVDFADTFKTTQAPAIGYVAFFSDVEHEIETVRSGNRVTFTYGLYFDDETGIREGVQKQYHPLIDAPPHQKSFEDALKAVLADDSILPGGGFIGFGLTHQYPVTKNTETSTFHDRLKGADAALKRACEALGLEWHLRVLYRCKQQYSRFDRYVLAD
ncbi:hypothetical protein CONPUDRAFT_98957, partial [Coniophora puteana RWD-64-598 SS2]